MLPKQNVTACSDRLYPVAVFVILCGILLVSSATGFAQITPTEESLSELYPGKAYSPYAERSFPDQVFWGDTHLHTGLSVDAGLFGARLGLDDAYRFARGEQVMASSGQPAKLGRPLDWLVIADHSDAMGFFNDLAAGEPGIIKFEQGKRWYDGLQAGGDASVAAALDLITTFSQGKRNPEMIAEYSPGGKTYESIWERVVDAAERFNDPGRFTALIGFEWTSLVAGNNLHRNVIFRDGAERAGQVVPYTTQAPVGSTDPLELYKWLENYENKTGGSALALAHNGNPSNGIMFPVDAQYTGRKLDQTYVESRARWERMWEISQIKGDGEAHPFTKTKNGIFEGYELVSSGYAAVWAKENTREAIWDAMERREVYGTTGSRITARFFGGWDYTKEDINSRQPAFRGYEKGVPMGGELRTHDSGAAPTFMVYALRDVIGANLDRIQIVKGWLDDKGETQEKVYDVAWSGAREPDTNGMVPPVGNTVDIKAANWSNTIGASELGTVWTDPDFDPEESAFCYARVLEVPTPRWVVYDAFRFGVEIPEGAETTHQERAYTSPIWYSP